MTDTAHDYDAWAWFYDRSLGPAYRDRMTGFLERALLRDLPAGARVLDLCCGTGQMTALIGARGFGTIGLDRSRAMLDCAARNAPDATLIEGDARDFTLDRPVSAVLCASASLNHMDDQDELSRVFACVHAALAPGGIFAFDVNHPAQMARHWLGDPAAGEIRAGYAWMITPRYDAASARGAFHVAMHRRPEGAEAAGGALWLALLNRPLMRGPRLRRLAGFARRHPGWIHRSAGFPVRGHDVAAVLERLRACGFAARVGTPSGQPGARPDSAACFICRKETA